MRLSNKGRYGVRAVFDIAFYGKGGAIQVKDIAERQRIPPRFLEQIFQELKRAGLVRSRRGPRGGFELGRKPEEFTVADVIRALEGPLGLGEEVSEATPSPGASASLDSAAFTDECLEDAFRQVEAIFAGLSLAHLCELAEAKGMRNALLKRRVYVI